MYRYSFFFQISYGLHYHYWSFRFNATIQLLKKRGKTCIDFFAISLQCDYKNVTFVINNKYKIYKGKSKKLSNKRIFLLFCAILQTQMNSCNFKLDFREIYNAIEVYFDRSTIIYKIYSTLHFIGYLKLHAFKSNDVYFYDVKFCEIYACTYLCVHLFMHKYAGNH